MYRGRFEQMFPNDCRGGRGVKEGKTFLPLRCLSWISHSFCRQFGSLPTYIVACLVWKMPSVVYGSSFIKSGLLIILQAGVTKVKSGVKHGITFELPKIALFSYAALSQKNRTEYYRELKCWLIQDWDDSCSDSFFKSGLLIHCGDTQNLKVEGCGLNEVYKFSKTNILLILINWLSVP